jgi:hypothetical protein
MDHIRKVGPSKRKSAKPASRCGATSQAAGMTRPESIRRLIGLWGKGKGQPVTNPALVELAMQVFQLMSTESEERHPVTVEPAADLVREIPPQEPIEVKNAAVAPRSIRKRRSGCLIPVKDTRTADELAAMILVDLSLTEGCPKRGVKVTVYGSNPWNAWLSFAAAAGPVRNKADLQNFIEISTGGGFVEENAR